MIFTKTSSSGQRPAPAGQGALAVDPLATDLRCEHRAKSVPPAAHGHMADLDAPLVWQVSDVAQRKRVPNLEHHRQADDLGTGLEGPEGGTLGLLTGRGVTVSPLKEFALTVPFARPTRRRARWSSIPIRGQPRPGIWRHTFCSSSSVGRLCPSATAAGGSRHTSDRSGSGRDLDRRARSLATSLRQHSGTGPAHRTGAG